MPKRAPRSLASKMGPARKHWAGGQFRDAARAVAKAAGWDALVKALDEAERLKGSIYVAHVLYYETGAAHSNVSGRLALTEARENADKIIGDLTRHVFHRLRQEHPDARRALEHWG